MDDFSFSDFSKDFVEEVVAVLEEEHLDTILTLLSVCEEDISDLKLKQGDKAVVREKVRCLQKQFGRGPMCVTKAAGPLLETPTTAPSTTLSQLLGLDTIPLSGAPVKSAGGPCLHIVDFVSSSALVEEEVVLGGGVTLKLNTKPKLEKISPAMWITANSRILRQLKDTVPGFSVDSYARYTEMVGELAVRYTWQSVLLFDEEYRQRQATLGFDWGTAAPHLSTVVLRDKPAVPAVARKATAQVRRPGQTGQEICRQFNSGNCRYGPGCKYDHACFTCGSREHTVRDHSATLTPGDSGNRL